MPGRQAIDRNRPAHGPDANHAYPHLFPFQRFRTLVG
jgi:hypothetical protein